MGTNEPYSLINYLFMRCFKIFLAVTCLFLVYSCGQKKTTPLLKDADVLHNNVDQLTQVIIYDVFTPPVASRIYGYTTLAAYETQRYADTSYSSIAAQLKGFGNPPKPEKGLK